MKSGSSFQRVLVFGANGQVGNSFQRIFATDPKTKDSVWYTSRSPIEFAAVMQVSEDHSLACDLTSEEDIIRVIQTVKPTLILNCAAYTAVDKAESERNLAQIINGVAPGIMAAQAKELNALLVHYSTDYVFNGSGEKPWDEQSKTDPVNYYGETKLQGEDAISRIHGKHLIVRTQWVYSDYGHNFVKTMLRFGAERSQLKVVGDQIGAPTSAALIAITTLDLIRAFENGRASAGIYNLAASGYVSWHEFAEQIFSQARALGRSLAVSEVAKIPSTDFPTPAKRPHNSRLNLTKIETILGHKMPLWSDALQPIMHSLCLNGAK